MTTHGLMVGINPAPQDAHARPRASELESRQVRDLLGGSVTVLNSGVRGARLRLRDADGCTSTRLVDWFSPSLAWDGCGTSTAWRSGRARVQVVEPLYPLQVGASGVYRRWATGWTGETSTRTTRCTVEDVVAVHTETRAIDAFQVTCDDGRITRTTWYAPGAGPVAYREAHHSRGVREAWIATGS